jgi:hypothetical protein
LESTKDSCGFLPRIHRTFAKSSSFSPFSATPGKQAALPVLPRKDDTMQYQDMTKKEMQREYHRLCQRYHEYEQQGLQLDLSRGKPAPEQLALSQRMLGELNSRSVLDSEDGTDCRNYGGLDGIPEAKALLAGMIGARPEQVMVGGNSSLTMMFDILSHAMLDGLLGAEPLPRAGL